MKLLITGGCGFVGSNLAFYFKERDWDVYVMDNLVRRGSEINLEKFKEKGIIFIHGDVRCPEDFNTLPKVDFICECSAQPSATEGYKNPVFDITNNSWGVLNVLEYARKINAGVVMWSTNKVYPGTNVNCFSINELETRWEWSKSCARTEYFSPNFGFNEKLSIDGKDHSIYGLSKVIADQMCQEYSDAFGVRTVINRFSCLAGRNQWGKVSQGWVMGFCIYNYFDIPIQYIGWKGKQVRDILFSEDICRLVEIEIQNIDKIKGEVFNVGGGIKCTGSLIEVNDKIKKILDKTNIVEVYENPRKADHCIYISDITKVKSMLGWEPEIGLEQGLQDMCKWVIDNNELLKRMYL